MTRHYALAAALLLATFLALGHSSARRKSLTFDELAHLPAAWAIWHLDDYRLNPTNGNLPKRIAGLPLLHTPAPTFPHSDAFRGGSQWTAGHTLLDGWEHDRLRAILYARTAMLAFAALGGLFLFALSARLWGPTGGVLSLALYTLSPTVLAHARLVTSDLTVSLTFLAATASFAAALRCLTLPRLAACALTTGLAAVSKMSAPILVFVLLALTTLRALTRQPTQTRLPWRSERSRAPLATVRAGLVVGLAAALGAVLAIWLAFGLRYAMCNPQLPPLDARGLTHWHDTWTSDSPKIEALRVARSFHLLPEGFLNGFAAVLNNAESRHAFLAGQHSTTGFPAFFPLALLWKTSLTTLSLLALLLPLAARSLRRRTLRRVDAYLCLILVYAAVALSSNLNIGHRHVLPLYPPAFLLLGSLAANRRAPWLRRLALAALLPLALETASVHPHYLAFFNQAAGGPQRGHELLVDSSLDWGQDLPTLADFAATTEDPLFFAYFGSANPAWYGLSSAHDLSPYPLYPAPPELPTLTPGTYAYSATLLQGAYGVTGPWTPEHEATYQRLRTAYDRSAHPPPTLLQDLGASRSARLAAFLRARTPDRRLAHTWFLYDLDAHDLQQALEDPLP